MPTKTAQVKAIESAGRRLKANQDALADAYASDVAEGAEFQQRHQWRIVSAWIRSEAKNVTDGRRQQILGDLIRLAQEMNVESRQIAV